MPNLGNKVISNPIRSNNSVKLEFMLTLTIIISQERQLFNANYTLFFLIYL